MNTNFAVKFLVKSYNQHVKGKGSKYPRHMWVNPAVYEAYESSLIILERFVDYEVVEPSEPTLIFKCSTLHKDPSLPTFGVRFD